MILYVYMFYMIIISVLLMLNFFYFLIKKIIFFYEFELFNLLTIKVEMVILLDWVSLMFMLVVMLISIMVLFYSLGYMSNDLNIMRFMLLVILFVLSMMLMILSPNMISILLGWDGLGLVSYCLVIYYQNESSFNSGMVTVLTNRVGDILILMMIGLLMYKGSWNFMYYFKLNKLILFMLIMAAITKSAQIPFSSWLPMAMAAPTPVSSLVHSSTLVTAGVYLLIRFNYLFINNNFLMKLMMMISLLTMFLAGFGASIEYDLKKIIALSTLSQLGIMIFSLSMGMENTAFFHLIIHAMFKSMLFMCAGVIIHNMMGNQDIRMISMILFNMPMISMLFNCSTLSLCGIPFMSGFFSKDLILEFFLMKKINMLILMILFVSMGFTVMYSFRLMFYSFIKLPQMLIYLKYKSLNNKMSKSMYFLFIMSIILGVILSWLLFSMKNMIYLSIMMKLMIYFFMFIGGLSSFLLMKMNMKNIILLKMNLYIKFFMMLWFMPMLYGVNSKKILILSNKFIYMLEMGWNEYIMGMELIYFIKNMFKLDNYYHSMLNILMFVGVLIFMIYLF